MEHTSPEVGNEVRPFLRWAGGKRWLIPQLPQLIGDLKINAYHEPFLGGGSAFLGLRPTGRAFLSDLNSELVETYAAVRDDPAEVSQELEAHKNTEDYYYTLRAAEPATESAKAARFIFLNHTSYNGIYRVNLSGRYNVPFGRRELIHLPSSDDLKAVSLRLKDAALNTADFAQCLADVREGDLVFLDPPYTIAHNHNNFVKYNQHLFSWEDQIRLSTLVGGIRDKGAFYILTNAAHPSVAELFEKGDRRIETSRRNAIGGLTADRGTAYEYLFTNVGQL